LDSSMSSTNYRSIRLARLLDLLSGASSYFFRVL